MAVNIHCAVGGRNCRDTIASLRNTRTTHHNVTNFFCWRGRQWLRRQRYHVLARIITECRYAEREGEDPDCKSDRPAAPATQSGSSSHALIFIPREILASPFTDPVGIFRPAHFTSLREECFSPSKENVPVEYCSDAPLLPRCDRLLLRRAYHRSRRQIPTSNLPPTIALR